MLSIMALTYIETEKYHKVSEAYHKVNEAKKGANPYLDEATETILSICKCLISIVSVANIGNCFVQPNEWMDDLRVYLLLTVFQSYQDDVWMITKGCV